MRSTDIVSIDCSHIVSPAFQVSSLESFPTDESQVLPTLHSSVLLAIHSEVVRRQSFDLESHPF